MWSIIYYIHDMTHIKGGLIMRRGRPRKPSPLDGHEDFITTHTRREIMKQFGVSYNDVNNYCIKYNLKPVAERRQISIAITDEIIEYAKTHTCVEVSNKFNLPYETLRHTFMAHDIKFYRHRGKAAEIKKNSCKRTGEAHDMIRELSKTFTMSAIARVFGYSKERIRQICSETHDNEK